MKDVAKEAGVSAQTVSNYFHRREVINPNTQLNIQKAIKKLNYTPNIFARGLRGTKTRTVGITIPEIANPFYSVILDGLEKVAARKGYTLIVSCNSFSKNKLQRDLDILSNHVDGIIVCTYIVDDEKIKYYLDKGIPIVAIDIKVENGLVPSIEIDNYQTVFNGVQYLIDCGHRNIYFFSEPLLLPMFHDRLNGYLDCLTKNNLTIDPEKIIIEEGFKTQKTEASYQIFSRLLPSMVFPAALIATSDLIPIGAMKAIVERKINIPDQVSLIGLDNIFLSEYSSPPLTTIDYPKREMGYKGMEMLINYIDAKPVKENRILLKTKIIERNSVSNVKP
ncbi:MAG: LacI family DNA-binding transcriptional regulator [Atribacterota bacterium]|nr:LacI family DNA-binding transcriptional regulator [Atribacterota bacterium]